MATVDRWSQYRGAPLYWSWHCEWSLRTGGLYTEVLHDSRVDIVNGHIGQVVSIQRCSTIVELTL